MHTHASKSGFGSVGVLPEPERGDILQTLHNELGIVLFLSSVYYTK